MSFVTLIFGWIAATSLGIGAIVAAEPLWIRRKARQIASPSRAESASIRSRR
jgi:hypothetical protein